jgi:sensor histidine kinase YesM
MKAFFLICLFACVPVYWATLFYIEIVTGREIEELAVAATIAFFGSFYIGWQAAKAWINRQSKQLMPSLAVLGLLLLFWQFIHADFQLRNQPAINLLLFWLPFILLGIIAGMMVRLARLSFQQQLQTANIGATQSKTELQLLQSQLSPHFLFNTLNNLYGLSLTQHEKLPPLLLKLSELLRYSVYDAKELFVPLKNELAYIHNYIDFEKIRMGERLQLTSAIEVVHTDDLKIAPMLLIVFIENAFKHAKNTTDKKITIDISIKTWEDTILFSVKNSHSGVRQNETTISEGGLGLANAIKRLELLYPNEHHITMEDKDGIYSVRLQVKTK